MKSEGPSVPMWAGTMLRTANIQAASLPVHCPQTFQWLGCLTLMYLYSANEAAYEQ